MGIQGLLPLLVQHPSGSSTPATEHLSQFANCTLGIDGHGWLHKAIYGCATALALNQPTTAYLVYFARRLRLLQSLNITPLVVLDGAPPPLKSETNAGRRQRRDAALTLGRQLHARGQVAEAERAFQSAVGIAPSMIQQLASLLKHLKVQYIIAPYEADPQLVYLERIGRIDAILSEDSDLLVFGARTLVTKWDPQLGTCQVLRAQHIFGDHGVLCGWTRNMLVDCAILAGCDYLASAPGVGIKTAMRAVEGVVNADRFEAARARKPSNHRTVIRDDDNEGADRDSDSKPSVPYRADTLTRAIRRLQFQSNKPASASTSTRSSATPTSHMTHLSSPTYLQSAIRARLAFRHARVWCPFTRRLVCLRPWPPAHERALHGSDYATLALIGVEETEYDGIGPWRPPEVAERVASGDVDPVTLQSWKHMRREREDDDRRVWEQIVRLADERPLSSNGLVVALGSSCADQAEDSEGFHFEDVDVFVEFETDLHEATMPEMASKAGNDEDCGVIPPSDDLPRLPASARSKASHTSLTMTPTHLPSPPISDPSSSNDSPTPSADSILASPTLSSHDSSLPQQARPAPTPQVHVPCSSTRTSDSQQHHAHRSHTPSLSFNLPSISVLRQLSTRPPPFQMHPSSSRKSAPAAPGSIVLPRKQTQPSLAAFMARKGSASAAYDKENHAGDADSISASSPPQPSGSHTHASWTSSGAVVPEGKKRTWQTAALDLLPAGPRVSGLFQAPRPTQEQLQMRSRMPPVKRARNTR